MDAVIAIIMTILVLSHIGRSQSNSRN
ncbi:hypothetical protein DXB55_01425 [Streptococcus anginosus]|nr:hypothetical protein DXB55_01425 [Streptococcus anginosus]